MHIYFAGIGGAGISPLAEIAHKAGYDVSGSDLQETPYIEYLRKHGVSTIHIGQDLEHISTVHSETPIDWFVRSSAVPDDTAEVLFCRDRGIKSTKRDELLNVIIKEQNLKLIAIAGTHGKSTTTAMVVWLFKQLGVPLSYLLPAKVSFGDMGEFAKESQFFVYECDEFDRNFLAFKPYISLISGISWDHHEIFPTREDYQDAFREFIGQSRQTFIWAEDAARLGLVNSASVTVLETPDYEFITDPEHIPDPADREALRTIRGYTNRLDAALAAQGVESALEISDNISVVRKYKDFPGLQRRMELIVPNLYSDYAHTPEKIRGAMSAALEIAADTGQNLIILYEPLTNRRQHYMLDNYKDCFAGAMQLYWIPSYLAREDPNQRILAPSELIAHLSDPSIATPALRDADLKRTIEAHLAKGAMIVGMAGGGGNSLDDWLRDEFQA
ncbi:hypothetical protein H7097_01765 [Aeromicrobium sp.]|nr:hypothetical protein [Candidatus Saccharibacteria bacterium]